MSNGDFAEMSEAVLDAGPLIHLAELEALDALKDFSALFVPMAVREEVECHQPGALKHPVLSIQHVFCAISIAIPPGNGSGSGSG
jgi:hypothetical protein